MIKSKKWFVAASVAAIFAVSGAVMAATSDTQNPQDSKRLGVTQKGDFVHNSEMKKNFKADRQALLDLLKVDSNTFRTELKDGKTMVTIAKEHGVSEKKLKGFIIDQRTKRIDEGVKAGRITAERAEKMKSNLEQRVSDMINGKAPMHKGLGMLGNKELLTLLKVDAETLKNELKAGKTLVAIGNDHGVSEQQLKDFMINSMTQRIDKGVESGRISTEKAEQMKAKMEQRVSDIINGKGYQAGYKHGQRLQK